jgi:ubiquitin thioesterase protein OTUB1
MITSAEIRKNAPEYEAFILHPDTQEPMPVAEFCSNFVEGMGKEAGKYLPYS